MNNELLNVIIQGGSFAALIYFGWYVIQGYRKQNEQFIQRMDELHSSYRKDIMELTGRFSDSLEQVSSKLENLSGEVGLLATQVHDLKGN